MLVHVSKYDGAIGRINVLSIFIVLVNFVIFPVVKEIIVFVTTILRIRIRDWHLTM